MDSKIIQGTQCLKPVSTDKHINVQKYVDNNTLVIENTGLVDTNRIQEYVHAYALATFSSRENSFAIVKFFNMIGLGPLSPNSVNLTRSINRHLSSNKMINAIGQFRWTN